jgi:D-sedoheptulose 7-phosphate isomerase
MTIVAALAEHARVFAEATRTLPPVLSAAADTMHTCVRRGNCILACGNGGSAADAEHLVAELVGRFRDERRALAAVALTASGATVTALANDYGYDRVFARQVEALARAGDILFAISTSGNSPNVIEAARAARARAATVIALTGGEGGRLAAEADIAIIVPATVVARIQEVHGFCIHAIVEALEARLPQPPA